MRVHELAKKLGIPSKELVAQIKEEGGEVKNHMSVVDEEMVELFLQAAAADSRAEKGEKKSASKSKAKSEAKKTKPANQKAEAHEAPSSESVKEAPEPKQKTEAPKPKVAEPTLAPEVTSNVIQVRFPITVGDLAEKFGMPVHGLIKELMGIGVFANVNQLLNDEIVLAVAEKLEKEVEPLPDEVTEILSDESSDDDEHLVLRPPVVTMMGHVDHGKTSLLDAIRKTNVAAREKGAITQHIGAYGVDIEGKGHVTFIDTPGHEAFTAMRARGANVTDVVVLVVAADDGIMPQTIEAIAHAREAGCPIVVAINKCDLPSANPDKVMGELQKHDLMPEAWGGSTITVNVSAKTGEGIDKLLEMLLLEAEVLELKANPDRMAQGIVIEGHLSKGSGAVATIIVQRGTLRVGDMVVCGSHMGRVKALRNDHGKNVKEAGPSYAVELLGLGGVAEAGENFVAVEDEKTARRITEKKVLEARELHLKGASKHLSLEDLYERISEGNFKELKLIIKADVQGSMEALADSLEKLSTDQCGVRVIHKGTGGINESDAVLASASDAVILGFHVKADNKAQSYCEREKVDMRFYGIIYEAVEDVRKAMEGLLEPIEQEVIEAKVEVRKLFKSKKAGTIAGCMVLKGKISRNNQARLIRDNVVLHEGKLAALRRFQDDVKDVQQGYECGISFAKYNDIREGDLIESFRIEKIAAKL